MGKTAGEHYVENPSDTQGAVVHTSTGTIRERPTAKPRDIFSVSDAKRKQYGIKDHEEVYWARDPKVWASIEHNDRVEELSSPVEDGGCDARLVMTPEMDSIHIGAHGDLVLMAYPKDVAQWRQEEIDEASALYEAPMRQTKDGNEFDVETLDTDKVRLKARMRAEADEHAAMGLAGGSSPTAGMSLIEAERYMKRIGYDVEGRQEMLRSAGMHHNASDEEFTAVMTGIKQKEKMATSKGRAHSMGNSGLGKTTAEKLAARGRA